MTPAAAPAGATPAGDPGGKDEGADDEGKAGQRLAQGREAFLEGGLAAGVLLEQFRHAPEGRRHARRQHDPGAPPPSLAPPRIALRTHSTASGPMRWIAL
jgi:hypothetical protein